MGERKRNWVITINNPQESPNDLLERLPALTNFRYLVFQKELGEEGTDHYQGYMEFTNAKSLSWMKSNVCPRGHYEARRGSRDQAREYCMKEESRTDGPWEAGEWASQGTRTDIKTFKDEILLGKRQRDLLDTHTLQMAKFPKFYGTVKSLYRPRREPESFVGVILLYGAPGKGKTRYVVENYPDYWEAAIGSGLQWFDGYDMHNVVLLDDFAGKMSNVRLDTTLKVLDRYVRQVPIKGGHVWWKPNLIFITTNIHPRSWYNWQDREAHYAALGRRIKEIYWYKQDDTVEHIEDKEDFFEHSHKYEEF